MLSFLSLFLEFINAGVFVGVYVFRSLGLPFNEGTGGRVEDVVM